MADDRKQFQFSLNMIEPAEHLMAAARKLVDSPDENRRAVAKALLDVTSEGLALKKAMETNTNADMAPYLDFWFADAIACAKKLLQYEDAESRDLGECLIETEKAVMKSKQSVLGEIKRLGMKRSDA
jgi:hypothetical protein